MHISTDCLSSANVLVQTCVLGPAPVLLATPIQAAWVEPVRGPPTTHTLPSESNWTCISTPTITCNPSRLKGGYERLVRLAMLNDNAAETTMLQAWKMCKASRA